MENGAPARVERALPCDNLILSQARLPVPPRGHARRILAARPRAASGLALVFCLGNDLDFDHGDAAVDDSELLRSRGRDVDDSTLHERPAVVHATDHRAMVAHIVDPAP